jgi:drug/metabolite transporter (DMT)-like permease
MAYILATGAAFTNALTTILQRLGVEAAPKETNLRLSLITYALKRTVWLAGFAVMIGGFVLQFASLHFGQMTKVQPILTLELPFLVVILWVWFGKPIGWREWLGAAAAAGGLAAFLLLAQVTGGHLVPSLESWGEVSFACLAAVVVTVLLAQVGSRGWRAAMYGVAGAVAFAFSAALQKVMNTYIGHGWSGLFLHWQPYALAGVGLLGVFLAQNAFHAGPVTASQSTLVIVDPFASILIGVSLFGDNIDTSGARGVLESVAVLVLFGGVVLLASSPLVAGAKGEAGRADEMLLEEHRIEELERLAHEHADLDAAEPAPNPRGAG